MIFGIGSDLISIDRVGKALERFGTRFEERVFTLYERQAAEKRHKAGSAAFIAFYAKRLAAKEACAKALGVGIGGACGWQDMEIRNLPSGQPVLVLSPRVQEWLQPRIPTGMRLCVHLSMSDDAPYAQSFVVIGAE